MVSSTQKKEEVTFSDRLADFIQKRRTVIIGGIIAIVGGIIAASVIIAIVEKMSADSITAVEMKAAEYSDLASIKDQAKLAEARDALVKDLTAIASKAKSGYVASRAHSVIADIKADAKDWDAARDEWVAAADSAKATYLSSVALYNAAVAAEEAGDATKALELLKRSVSTDVSDFPLAARAYFAQGRLLEDARDFAGATAAYQKVVDTWPTDNWTKLAKSRILSIAAQGM